MVELVRRACDVPGVDRVVVATDDERVADVVIAHGGEAVLTGPAACGTDRVWSALQLLDKTPALVVNVQGDMPLLPPIAITAVISMLRSGSSVATVATPWPVGTSITDPAVVKVEVDSRGRAIRFTRRAVSAWRHVGIYGFRYPALRRAIAVDRSTADSEDLEQIAWMREGLVIDVALIPDAGPAVDTLEQLESVRRTISDPMYPTADR